MMPSRTWPTFRDFCGAYWRLIGPEAPNYEAGAQAAGITPETFAKKYDEHGVPRKRRRKLPMPEPPAVLLEFMAAVAPPPYNPRPPAPPPSAPPPAPPPSVPAVRSFSFSSDDPSPVPLPNFNLLSARTGPEQG